MIGRGMLICPFIAVISPLNREEMLGPFTDAQGESFASGIDPEFGEPVLVDPNNDGEGQRRILWQNAVEVPVQVESVRGDTERMRAAGNSPDAELRLVMHFADLERLGLVNAHTGNAIFLRGDRLDKIMTIRGVVQQTFDPPLYIEEVEVVGWGLNPISPQRNLLVTTWSPHESTS